jgi:conjugal transfer pilus assembly protein TraI
MLNWLINQIFEPSTPPPGGAEAPPRPVAETAEPAPEHIPEPEHGPDNVDNGAEAIGFLAEEIPRYPPFMKGLPLVSPSKLIDTQTEIIGRIRRESGVTLAEFEATYLRLIEAHAGYVHLLPASEAHHHRGAGGLFRHSLEVGLAALLGSRQMVFALDETPARRRVLQPIWRLVVFCAALNHDIGKPSSDVEVTDREGQTIWNPFAESLAEWGVKNGVAHYFLRWRSNRHQRHESLSSLVVPRVIDAEIMAYIHSAGAEATRQMLGAISNDLQGINPVREMVMKCDMQSVERDLKKNGAVHQSTGPTGVPADRFVLDAMRRMIRSGDWKINKPGALVWVMKDSTGTALYISWKLAAKDISRMLSKDKIPGVPRDPDSMADMMIERGMAISRQTFNGPRRYFNIRPGMLAEQKPDLKIMALRLSGTELLFDEPPPPVPGTLVTPESEGSDPPVNPVAPPPEINPEPSPPSPPEEPAPQANPEPADARPPRRKSEPTASAPKPATDPSETARQHLMSMGKGGEVLVMIAEDIGAGRVDPKSGMKREGGNLLLAYPDSLSNYGRTAQDICKMLLDTNAIETDPARPMAPVRTMEGFGRAVVLTEAVTRMVDSVASSKVVRRREQDPERQPKRATPESVGEIAPQQFGDDFIRMLVSSESTLPKPVNFSRAGKTIRCSAVFSIPWFLQKAGIKMPRADAQSMLAGHPRITVETEQGKDVFVIADEVEGSADAA